MNNLTKIFDVVTLVVFILDKIDALKNRCKRKMPNEKPEENPPAEIETIILKDSVAN